MTAIPPGRSEAFLRTEPEFHRRCCATARDEYCSLTDTRSSSHLRPLLTPNPLGWDSGLGTHKISELRAQLASAGALLLTQGYGTGLTFSAKASPAHVPCTI